MAKLPPANETTTGTETPLVVILNILIQSFDNISMKDMVLGVMFRLNLIWKDERLQYKNIKTDPYLVRAAVAPSS